MHLKSGQIRGIAFLVNGLSVVDHGLRPTSGQTNDDYEIGICCFSAKYTSLRSKRQVDSESG